MARREADPLAGRYWKIANEGVRNSLGQPVAYKLLPNHVIKPFAHPDSAVARRAPFMFHPLWVTAYDQDEIFATGDYPNQSPGGQGLPAFAARERSLTDTDVVLWFTFGTNHVVRPEDWPVMPVHPIGFKLLPAGFFVGNPALDNPEPAGGHCHHHDPNPNLHIETEQ
jgi:primary-amine oxidase